MQATVDFPSSNTAGTLIVIPKMRRIMKCGGKRKTYRKAKTPPLGVTVQIKVRSAYTEKCAFHRKILQIMQKFPSLTRCKRAGAAIFPSH
jgi:hypothetical protein